MNPGRIAFYDLRKVRNRPAAAKKFGKEIEF